jgi:hypothetical protein
MHQVPCFGTERGRPEDEHDMREVRTALQACRAGRFLLLAALVIGGVVSAAAAEKSAESKQPAETIFRNSLAEARKSARAGFFEVSAPGCGWCRRMNRLFSNGEAAEVLRKYYVYIPVDVAENPGTADLARKLGRKKEQGTPWYAVVDANGKALATSDAPTGNIGFPGNDQERADFLSILRSTAKGISQQELGVVESGLKAAIANPAKK